MAADADQLIPAGNLQAALRWPAAAVILLVLTAHAFLWSPASILAVFSGLPSLLTLFVSCAATPFIHESLHLFGYAVFGGARRHELHVQREGVMAYAHCDRFMPTRTYRMSLALPGAILGVIPAVAGLLFSLPWLTAYGAFALAGAAGDAAVLWAIRRVPAKAGIRFRAELAAYQIRPALNAPADWARSASSSDASTQIQPRD